MGRIILFEEISIGMLVADLDHEFGIGTVITCNDIHNVFVRYTNGGSGLYCLDPNCDDYDPLCHL